MRWLFVHIPKNGGMSIRSGIPEKIVTAKLLNLPGDYAARVLAKMNEHGEHHGYEHARWRDVKQEIRDRFSAVAIVRNPWSRVVSRYTFSCLAEKKTYSFKEFLDERHIYGDMEYFWHRAIRGWYPQVDYVMDESGNKRCDILRFGTSDVEQFFDLKKPLKRRNISNVNSKDYRDFYDSETHDIIADWYRKDIEYFGFTFDGHATRNVWKPT